MALPHPHEFSRKVDVHTSPVQFLHAPITGVEELREHAESVARTTNSTARFAFGARRA
jgi:hypothetical protein